MKNFYHVLGLSFESNPELSLINAAYKALVKIYHPDVFNGDKKNLKRKISEINEAFEVLSHPTKKKEYDEKLRKFQKDKFYDFSEEKFDDSDQFNSKFVDEDWEIATIVYPELDNKKKLLSKFSQKLALQFQFYLLETKEFHVLDLVENKFLDAFLEKKFGSSNIIQRLSKVLILQNQKDKALYLNKLVKVVGSYSDKKILDAFFKRFPDIEDQVMSIVNLQKINKINKNNENEIQKIILILSLVFLVIYIFVIT